MDQAAAVKRVLKDRPYLDSSRVGSWGWSGGGSMSLNAIFKYPDLYKTAIAVAAVPKKEPRPSHVIKKAFAEKCHEVIR